MSSQEENTVQMSETELFLKYAFSVDPGQEPERIDKYLVNKIEGASRNKLQEAIERKQVVVNGKAIKSNYKVKPNDYIEVSVTRNLRKWT